MKGLNLVFGIIGVVGTIFGIIGVVLTVQNRSYHQLAYYLSEPALIVDASQSIPSIQVLDTNGSPVEGPVYVATLVIWNSGTEPISYNEALRPVEVISSSSVQRILSSSITDTLRDSRANFDIFSPESTPPQFILEWKEFDPGTAVKIQIVFEGQSERVERQRITLFHIDSEFVKGELIQGFNDRYNDQWNLLALAILSLFALTIYVILLVNRIKKGISQDFSGFLLDITLLTLVCIIVYSASSDSVRGFLQSALISPL